MAFQIQMFKIFPWKTEGFGIWWKQCTRLRSGLWTAQTLRSCAKPMRSSTSRGGASENIPGSSSVSCSRAWPGGKYDHLHSFNYYLLIVVYEDDWKSFLGLIHFGRFDAWDFVALVPRWPYPFKASSVACPWFPAVANLWLQLMQGSDWAWGSGSDTEAKREMCATGHATFGRFFPR